MSGKSGYHPLKTAFLEGMGAIPFEELMAGQVAHNSLKGEWETGVVSPSLVATQCRLARLKRFLGDGPQPGVTDMGWRAGKPDPITRLNFVRGFDMEGLVVPCLKYSLGEAVVGHAPELLFRWRYQGDDPKLSMWMQGGKSGMVFAGHPDMLIQDEYNDWELATVQIKCPSLAKLQRIMSYGDQDALETYRGQMATEMFIGRMMGYPIERSYLLLAAFEGTPRYSVHELIRVVELPWEEMMRSIPEEIARELVSDYDEAVSFGRWPEAYPEQKWDQFPCSYCQFARLGNFEVIGCEEQGEWQRFAETGETRLSVPAPDEAAGNVVSLRRAR